MELSRAIEALAALAHDTRMSVFRLLMRQGPAGLPAGALAERLGVAPSTLSFHLAQLERAGLLRCWRVQRQIFYAADLDGIRGVLAFLTEECCQGRPELCGIAAPGGYLPAVAPAAPASVIQAPASVTQGDFLMSAADPAKVYNVLFLCTGNSARSVLAECALGRFGGGRFRAFSAGSHPKGRVHPMTLRLLERLNYRTADLRSKSWDEFARPDSPPLHFVFTVCDNAAGEVCPAWPGQPMTAHWGVEDPADFVGPDDKALNVFKRVYLELENRIKIFASLRLEALDRLALQQHLNDIGTARLAPEGNAA